MTIKFFKPSDPTISDIQHSEWFRDNMRVESIEQIDGDPSAYFVMTLKEAYSEESMNFKLVVKHKNFFREHFANYNEAMEVINRAKEKAYGR